MTVILVQVVLCAQLYMYVNPNLFVTGRTQDVTESVRKVAYRILAEKVNMKSFTIAQRVQLLSNGLHDRSGSINDLCAKELLGAWLKSFDKDIIKLLKCLDVEGCTEVAELALKAILKGTGQLMYELRYLQ